MARALILSSFTAASRVGGEAQALVLARLGIEPVLVPTVVFGRHPGHGPPGGLRIEPCAFASMLEAVAAQGGFAGLDAVITGYFASAEQVDKAADALQAVRAASPGARLVVDPIMGDAETGLYVAPAVAEALARRLVPLADLVTPNLWELGRLAGGPVRSAAEALVAARALGRSALVSSIAARDRIGALYAGPEGAWLAAHPWRAASPKGAGDLLTALFTAARIVGAGADAALGCATGALAAAVDAAEGLDAFPIAALPTALSDVIPAAVERLDG